MTNPKPKVVGTIPQDAVADGTKAAPDRPSRPLPTDRVSHAKQMEQLRGYAALVAQGVATPTNTDVAALIGIHKNTSILTHPFFLDVGLLKKHADGYTPAPEVLAYGKAHNWNADTAAQKLAPVLRSSWLARALLPKVALNGLDERKAIEELAVHVSASPKYEPQIKAAINWLVISGLVRRDGNLIRAVHSDGPAESEQTAQKEDAPPARETETHAPPPRSAAGTTTAFAHAPEGRLQFSVDVNVDMREFASWAPERITAFWAGIAQVLAAKAAVEKQGGV